VNSKRIDQTDSMVAAAGVSRGSAGDKIAYGYAPIPMRPATGARNSVNSRSSVRLHLGGLLRGDCLPRYA